MAAEPGLRERQKARRRADIIAAGRRLFLEQGYSATSVEAVAETAEVGVATVYNYFGTKGGLLAEILRPDFIDVISEGGAAVVAKRPADPVDGVLSLIEIYRQIDSKWKHKEALMAVLGPGLSAEPVLDELAVDAEMLVKQQLEELLSAYQDTGSLRDSIDVTDAATIIFYVFNQHWIEHITHKDSDYRQMSRKMDRQIKFIVSAIRT